MSGKKDDRSEEKLGRSRPARRIAKASEMQHPDFYALLSFAEGALDREARRRIAAHVLICQTCSAELEDIEMEVLPEMERPISVTERLSWLAARLVGRVRGPRQMEQEGQARILIPAFVRGEREGGPSWRTLAVHGADETYRFLTVLDEDEAGELYLFMSIYGEREGPVYCWPVEGAEVALPFIPDEKERHRYQAYLTDREVPVPEGIHVDPKINADERNEERKRLLAAFLEALDHGEVNYRAAEQEIKP